MSKNPLPQVDVALFDTRTVERHLVEGRTTQEAYEAHLASLPDDAAECVESDVRFVVRGRTIATTRTSPGDDDEG